MKIPVVISGCVNEVNNNKFVKEHSPTWYENFTPCTSFRLPALRKIKADSKTAEAKSLPTVSVSNMRSLLPKIRNFAEDMVHRNIQIALLCEVWEKSANKKYQQEIERMLELNGLKYISCPRAGGRTGGGVGIVANSELYSIKKIEIANPFKLECVWTLVRGKTPAQGVDIKDIICASFYSPPNSRKNSKLIDHLISSVHYLQSKYTNACFILGGDKNKLPLVPLLEGLPGFQQIVNKFTYKEKTLDVILTNCAHLFSNPITVEPVQPDDPNIGKPSDHLTVVAIPLDQSLNSIKREYIIKTVRPIPESGVEAFSNWLSLQEWSWLEDNLNPSRGVERWEEIIEEKINEICPSKNVKLSSKDKPFMTGSLKEEFRRLCRIYNKSGKSNNFKKKKKKFQINYKKAAKAFIVKNVTSIMEEAPGKASKALKQLSRRPGDCQPQGSFRLSSHLLENLSTEESIERFVKHFSEISQEFDPLDIEKLPINIKQSMSEEIATRPTLMENEVLKMMKLMKKTKSSVPGDIPPKLRSSCQEELVKPVTIIFNSMIKSGIWPDKWKIEFGIPLPKNDDLEDEDDTRIISITNHLSKLMEKFVFKWLLEIIGHLLDKDQYGAMKGNSITHYLIELVNFILFNQDMKDPKATLALMVDLTKAFNRIDHTDVIIILHEMGVPGWLLKIVAGFLTNRKLRIRMDGKTSTLNDMPGGGPQGTILGLLIFIIVFNLAGSPSSSSSHGADMNLSLKKRKPIQKQKFKYIDDLTFSKCIDMTNSLRIADENELTRPLAFHSRTEHILPDELNEMQKELTELEEYCEKYKMKINPKKTKAMLFNSKIKSDFQPVICLRDGNVLEVVDEFKLLGIIITSDMKWNQNTKHMIKKAYKRMWMLKRLKNLGASKNQLKITYIQQVRSVLEMAVPVWHPGLTISNKIDIERVQKSACHIILGDKYETYERALSALGLDNLHARRVNLCKAFALKNVHSEKYTSWFKINHQKVGARRIKKKYKEINCRTKRFKNSPIPYLTRVLNLEEARKTSIFPRAGK